MNELFDNYDIVLVVLSYFVSVFGAFAALQMANRIRGEHGHHPVTWLITASVALGGVGIWSMHFIGMLALRMDLPVSYDVTLTLASLVLAIVVVGIGLGVVARRHTAAGLLTGGTITGLGVSGMHYTGMEAMIMPAVIVYDPVLVALSVLIGVVAAIAALWLAFNVTKPVLKGGASLVMGLAVCGMHYTGLAAAEFQATGGEVDFFTSALAPDVMAWSIAGGSGLFLAFSLMFLVADQLGDFDEEA